MQPIKTVVVHRGARDRYHVARALAGRGLLETLVTDLHWPSRSWAEPMIPAGARRMLKQRSSDAATSERVSQCWASGIYSEAMSRVNGLPFEWKRRAIRWCDSRLGERAGKLATARDAALLSYSYYGQSAFANYSGRHPRILFQLHPHPKRVREILLAERARYPECAGSLDKEWELALPEEDFAYLTKEPAMADQWIAASSFTRDTLTDCGIPRDRIHVVPYGADLDRFRPAERSESRVLRLLFVGTINQRKGIKYLLDAMAMLPRDRVKLTVCGRVVDDLRLFEGLGDRVEVRPSVSAEELVKAYRAADVFVFPSLAEGFGHVLLEAMASGLAVVSTTRTAARDLISPGVEGFLVEPGNAAELAGCLEMFLEHPDWAARMGAAARRRAEEFTWQRFENGICDVVQKILHQSELSYV